MDNKSISFDNFREKFYSNTSNTKIVLQVDIENSNKSDTNIYDIHDMLFDLLLNGFERLYIIYSKSNPNITMIQFFSDQELINTSIKTLQHFFSNINIKINVQNLSKKDLISESSPYTNRYFRVIIDDNIQQFIKNGAHQIVDDLTKINSFLLIDDINNICVSFCYL